MRQQENHTGKMLLKYHTFQNQQDRRSRPPSERSSRERKEIQLYCHKWKRIFRRENLSQYQFLAALIFQESKSSEGMTILQFEFLMTLCETSIKRAVSRNSAKLGNYKMPGKLTET